VERILKAFKLKYDPSSPQLRQNADLSSPYDILDLPVSATEADVKKQYRKKSLMIHPDKFKHDQGPDVSSVPLVIPVYFPYTNTG
jgi:DnaJ family protein C protein 8